MDRLERRGVSRPTPCKLTDLDVAAARYRDGQTLAENRRVVSGVQRRRVATVLPRSERMFTAIVEGGPGPSDEIRHRPRHQHLARPGQRLDSGRDVNSESGDVIAASLVVLEDEHRHGDQIDAPLLPRREATTRYRVRGPAAPPIEQDQPAELGQPPHERVCRRHVPRKVDVAEPMMEGGVRRPIEAVGLRRRGHRTAGGVGHQSPAVARWPRTERRVSRVR